MLSKRSIIFTAAITAIVITISWLQHSRPEESTQDSQALTKSKHEIIPDSLPSPLPAETSELLSNQYDSVGPVSLEEIKGVSTTDEATLLFQRLSVELINELQKLEKTTDSNVIASRLSPLVQNFYYLKRIGGINQPQERLPHAFQGDIQHLEELWNNNSTLAQTADNIFSSYDLLQYEHVPYQLRAELALN